MKSITINGKPKGKGRVRLSKSGHAYTPKETKIYEEEVKGSYLQLTPDNRNMYENCGVKVEINAYFNTDKELYAINPDVDNIAKIILDALNGLAYKDDKQVIELNVKKIKSDKDYVEVFINDN